MGAENSGQDIGIISAVAFNFIVHDPNGIIVRSSADRDRKAGACSEATLSRCGTDEHRVPKKRFATDQFGRQLVGSISAMSLNAKSPQNTRHTPPRRRSRRLVQRYAERLAIRGHSGRDDPEIVAAPARGR